MLRSFVVGGAVAVALLASTAANAGGSLNDNARRDPGEWGGLYIGVHGGWAAADFDHSFNTNGYFNKAAGDTIDYDKDGGLLGGHVGYNWQRGSLVFGVEAGIAKAWLDSKEQQSPYFSTDRWSSEVEWIGSVTPRVGIALGDSLVYAKGGWAFGEVKDFAIDTIDPSDQISSSDTRNGWTIGGGAEFKLKPNLVLGVEYNYYDLGSENIVSTVDPTADYDYDVTVQAVTARLSYRFGEREAPAPLK